MQWDASPTGGFSSGRPWLPPVDPAERGVAAQRDDPDSLLSLYRQLIALRRALRGPLEPVDADDGVLAYRRGEHVVAVNLTEEERAAPPHRERLCDTHPGVPGLSPHAAIVAME
jgi:alpha-glucosidase